MSEQAVLQPPDCPSVEQLVGFVRGLGPCDADGPELTPLTGGCHNTNYMCEGGPPDLPERFVLRHGHGIQAARAIKREHATLQFLGERLGERLVPQALGLYCPPALGGTAILLEEYVEGKHVTDLNTLTIDETKTLAAAVSKVHAITSDRFSVVPGGEADSCGTYADYIRAMVYRSVMRRLQGVDLAPYPGAEQLFGGGCKKLCSMIAAPEFTQVGPDQYTKSNGDLNPLNILFRPDGGVTIVDWDNQRVGDPAADASYVFVNNGWHSAAHREVFFGAYTAPTTCGDIAARIPAHDLANGLDDYAWIITRPKSPDPKQWHQDYAVRRETLETLAAA